MACISRQLDSKQRGDVLMNIMITCIGVLQENAPDIKYNKGMITARMTSEACCKYLLKKRGHAPDVIIALCTSDAYKENKVKKCLSGYSYFETAVRDFCGKEKIDIPDFEMVKISKRKETANYYGKSIYKVRQLIQKYTLNYDTRIMIDTAMNAYPINIMLQMMTRLFNNDGYKVIESYYTYPEKGSITEDSTNQQLDLIEAISEFSNHGTADKMQACFTQNTRKKPDPIVVRLMEAMQAFSESIQLCQTERLQDILNNEVFPTLEEIENMSGETSMREDIFTIKLMAEDIRKKFGYSKNGETFVTSPMLLVDPYDVLAEILSNAKQKSETDEKNVFENADIINDIDEIIQSEDLEFFKEETSIKFQLCNVEGKTTDDNLVFQCSEENEKAAKDTDDVTINTDMNLETTSKETESGSAKKFHFSSSSKFRRAVGRYHSDKKIASNAKPIIKHNKHFC